MQPNPMRPPLRSDVQGQMAAVAAVNMVRMQHMAQSMAMAQQAAASAASAAAAVAAMAQRSRFGPQPLKGLPRVPEPVPMDMTHRPFNKHGAWTPHHDGLSDTEVFLQAAAKRGISVRPAPISAE